MGKIKISHPHHHLSLPRTIFCWVMETSLKLSEPIFGADNCLSSISITHPKHILKILNGPFRLTISLKMKGCTEVQSSTRSLMQHLINQLMQLLYYRSPFCADGCKTARWLLLTASAITFALPGWQRIEHSKFFNIFIRLLKVRVTLVLKSTNP